MAMTVQQKRDYIAAMAAVVGEGGQYTAKEIKAVNADLGIKWQPRWMMGDTFRVGRGVYRLPTGDEVDQVTVSQTRGRKPNPKPKDVAPAAEGEGTGDAGEPENAD